MDNTATLYFRGIPRNVRDMFKAACAKKGLSMRESLLLHMREMIRVDAEKKIRLAPSKKR